MKRRFLQGIMLIVLIFLFAVSIVFAEGVSVTTDTEQYVLPVAELASTKTEPDILTIENDDMRIELIPNRGRLLTQYYLKAAGISFFHRNLVPDPMILESGLHAVEFGGYYLSVPWNTRDRQPFDLGYEITKESESGAEIYLTGRDMFKKTLTECWLRVSEDSAVVEIEVKITNESKSRKTEIDLMDYAILSPLENDRRATLVLPTSSINLVSSANDWFGPTGEKTTIDKSQLRWKKLEDYLNISFDYSADRPYFAITAPRKKAALVHWWEPADIFDHGVVESWGTNYHAYEGIGPYYIVRNVHEKVELQPQESLSFTSYFAGVEMSSRRQSLDSIAEEAGRR